MFVHMNIFKDCENSKGFFCDGRCIERYERCDFMPDCKNALEEHNSCMIDSFTQVPDCNFMSGEDWENKQCTIKYNAAGELTQKAHYPFMVPNRCLFKQSCPKGYYRCVYSKTCVYIKHVCDGIAHCKEGDDELGCS